MSYYSNKVTEPLPITGLNTLMYYEFENANTQFSYHYTRVNFFALIVQIGSLLYTLRTISNGMVLNLSNFSIDNKMIKILYNIDKLDQNG